jgi:hypothetical protein
MYTHILILSYENSLAVEIKNQSYRFQNSSLPHSAIY